MTRRRGGRLTAATLAGVLLVATGCGGDDDGADTPPTEADASDDRDQDGDDGQDADDTPVGSLDDAAFCARFEEMEDEFDDADDDEFDAEAFAALAELAAAAPDPGVRDALLQFGELAAQLEGLDDDDPAAFGIALGLMFDPEFLASMETLERYLVDVCGFDDTGFGFDDGFDSGVDEVDIAFDEDAYDEVWDDLSLLRDPIEERLGNSVQGIGTMRMMGPPTITLDVDTDAVDPLEACEVAGDVFDELLAADGLPVEVNDLDFEVIASRPPGGTCELG